MFDQVLCFLFWVKRGRLEKALEIFRSGLKADLGPKKEKKKKKTRQQFYGPLRGRLD